MRKKWEKQDIVAGCLFLLAVIFCLLKCLVTSEISLEDESNYVATAFRFFKGDAILVDDWSPWQLSSWIILPFVYIFIWITGTTEGIVLYFRVLYVFLKLLISFCVIYKLRKAGEQGIYIYLGVAFFFCFSPFNIDSLSYNTISIAMVLLVSITILTECSRRWEYFLCGLFLAIAILASPFFVIFYLLWGVVCIIYEWINRKKEKRIPVLMGKNFVWMTIGAASLAVVFLVFALSRARIGEIFANLPYLINEPDHNMTEGGVVFSLLKKVWVVVKIFFREYIFVSVLNIVCIMVSAIMIWKKKRSYMLLGMITCLVISCAWIIIRKTTFMQNAFFIPFVRFAIEELVIGKKIRISEILSLGTALLFSACVAMGTNTAMFATSATFCVVAVLSMVLLERRVKEIWAESEKGNIGIKRGIRSGVILLVSVTFAMHMMIVWLDVFQFSDFSNYLTRGPLRGTFAQKKVVDSYENILNVLDMVEYEESDILLCCTPTPTAYLYSNVNIGTIGTYFFYMDYGRLDEYFELHPDKFPTLVYYESLGNEDKKSNIYKEIEENFDI